MGRPTQSSEDKSFIVILGVTVKTIKKTAFGLFHL